MMTCTSSTLYLAATLTGIILSFFVRKSDKPARKRLPGPKVEIPFIGHILSLLGGPDLVKKSRMLKWFYGNIFSYKIIGMNTVHLCSYDLISKTLKRPEVSSRIPFQRYQNINEVLSDIYQHGFHGLVVTEGKEWQEQRRFTFKTLKDFGFGKSSMEDIMHEEIKHFSYELRKDSGPNVDLSNKFNILVTSTIWRIIGGKRFNYNDSKLIELITCLKKGFSAIAPTPRLALLFLFPFLRKLAPGLTGFEAMQKGYHGIYSFLKEEIEDHQKNLDPDNPKDFVDAYMVEMKKKEDNEETNSFFYKDLGLECLFCVLCDLFLAGSETTATNLQWAVIFLMRHPEIQVRIQQEIDDVVGRDRLPRMSDQANTPYTMAFIDEVHRKASIVPQGVQHWTNQDLEVGGYLIPKDSIVVPNLWEVHHDKETWGDPHMFRPDRFLDKEGKYVKSDRVIPFSLGTRRCPGETMAKSEIYLFLSSLIQQFDFSPSPSSDLPSLDYHFGFTLLPKAFTVNIKPR